MWLALASSGEASTHLHLLSTHSFGVIMAARLMLTKLKTMTMMMTMMKVMVMQLKLKLLTKLKWEMQSLRMELKRPPPLSLLLPGGSGCGFLDTYDRN